MYSLDLKLYIKTAKHFSPPVPLGPWGPWGHWYPRKQNKNIYLLIFKLNQNKKVNLPFFHLLHFYCHCHLPHPRHHHHHHNT